MMFPGDSEVEWRAVLQRLLARPQLGQARPQLSGARLQLGRAQSQLGRARRRATEQPSIKYQ